MNSDLYWQAKANGATDRLAEMLACRTPPGLRSEKGVVNGVGQSLEEQLGEEDAARLKANAAAMGLTLRGDEVYMPNFAATDCDPRALVDADDVVGGVRRLAEEQDCDCYIGDRQINSRKDWKPEDRQVLADDLAHEQVMNEVDERELHHLWKLPESKRKKEYRERRERVEHDHGLHDPNATEDATPYINQMAGGDPSKLIHKPLAFQGQ